MPLKSGKSYKAMKAFDVGTYHIEEGTMLNFIVELTLITKEIAFLFHPKGYLRRLLLLSAKEVVGHLAV